jgi:Domain of unknown function (DUF4282)
MTYDPGNPGDQPQPPGGQGWSGGQQPPYPGGYGQQPPQGWGPPPGQPPYGDPSAYGPGPGPGPGPGNSPQAQAKGFFSALFDFGFNHFATPSVVKIIYVVGLVLLGLAYIGFVIAGFAQGVGPGLLVLILGAIVALFYLTLFRITLEFYYAVVRMSEDIHHRR